MHVKLTGMQSFGLFLSKLFEGTLEVAAVGWGGMLALKIKKVFSKPDHVPF